MREDCYVYDFESSYQHAGFPGSSVGKESTCNVGGRGDMDSIPGWEHPLKEGNGNPLQQSCLKSPMDRVTRRDIVHGTAKSWT